uniref:Uncharacterized protein n=1 Tax=Manihot esculenta TaxID=3983 RepID=A0A2C9UXY6_MANES
MKLLYLLSKKVFTRSFLDDHTSCLRERSTHPNPRTHC